MSEAGEAVQVRPRAVTCLAATCLATSIAAAESISASCTRSQSARDLAVGAREAARHLQALSAAERVAVLNHIADELEAHEADIMAANAKDVAAAGGNISDSLLQRLVLKPNKIRQLAGAHHATAPAQRHSRVPQAGRCVARRVCCVQGARPACPTTPRLAHGAAHEPARPPTHPAPCRWHPLDRAPGGAAGPRALAH